jgi:outer membrane protein
MRNNITFIAIAGFVMAICSLAVNVQAQERDILELYRLAKGKDPAVSRAEARLEGGKAEKDLAWSGLLPRVSANGSARQLWHKVLNYNNSSFNGEYTGYSYGAGVAFPLFNLPSYYQLAVADAGIDSADAFIQSVRQDLIVRILDAYVKLLKAKADEKLFRDELGRVGKVLEQTEAFLKAGTGDIISVYEARARMDSAAADLIKAEGQLRMAQQNLALLSGVAVESVKDIAVSRAEGPQPAAVEWWVETMRQRHPDLVRARADLSQAEESVRAASAGHYPTVDGNGGYTVDKGSTFLPNVETQQWYVGVRLNIPIYSGGEVSARKRRALAGESERRAQRDDTEESAMRRLKEAFVNLRYTESLVAAYQRKQESAEIQLKAVTKGRDIGTRTAIDLLNAEQTYAVSRRDLSNALYDNLLRRFELKAAAGILVENDLYELSGVLARNN